jgi:hypothetical protein
MNKMNGGADVFPWAGFFLIGGGWSFTVYVVVQALALAIVRGRGRWWIALPIPIMAAAVLWTLDAFFEKSKAWPIIMIFASPVAIVYILIAGGIALYLAKARGKRGTQ